VVTGHDPTLHPYAVVPVDSRAPFDVNLSDVIVVFLPDECGRFDLTRHD
jgi:hypothetical protein